MQGFLLCDDKATNAIKLNWSGFSSVFFLFRHKQKSLPFAFFILIRPSFFQSSPKDSLHCGFRQSLKAILIYCPHPSLDRPLMGLEWAGLADSPCLLPTHFSLLILVGVCMNHTASTKQSTNRMILLWSWFQWVASRIKCHLQVCFGSPKWLCNLRIGWIMQTKLKLTCGAVFTMDNALLSC